MTAREHLINSPPSEVFVLEPAKAARFKAATMLVPSPLDIRTVILEIPAGTTMTVSDIKARLAQNFRAECVCPFSMSKGWQLVARAAEEDRSEGRDPAPWWRLTIDGKPSPKMPGGTENHLALIQGEVVKKG